MIRKRREGEGKLKIAHKEEDFRPLFLKSDQKNKTLTLFFFGGSSGTLNLRFFL